MRSSATTRTRIAARLQEAAERIYDPATIEAKLSGMPSGQSNLLLKLYRASRAQLTAGELRQRAELVGLFKDSADEIEAEVQRIFSNMGGDSWDYNAVRRLGRDRMLLDQIRNRIMALGSDIKTSVDDGLLSQYKRAYVDGAYRIDITTPESVNIQFGLLPDRAILTMLEEPWNGARFSDRLGLITDDMAHNVQHEIIKSMMNEESWQDTARRIRDEMGTKGQRSVWRAEMVARTELAHAQTMANSQLYDENEDVLNEPIWVAHPGACDECIEKHGRPVSEVGYPPSASHPNCVCDILAVPKSWGELAIPEDGDFTIRPISRAKWGAGNGVGVLL